MLYYFHELTGRYNLQRLDITGHYFQQHLLDITYFVICLFCLFVILFPLFTIYIQLLIMLDARHFSNYFNNLTSSKLVVRHANSYRSNSNSSNSVLRRVKS